MNRELYGEAYQRNFEPMVRALMRRGFRRTTAEEIVQSACVRGLERLDQLRDDRSVVVWLRRIAANKWWDELRSRQRTRQLQPEDTIAVPPAVNLAGIDVEKILTLIDCERQRVICSHVYLDEWSSEQVARKMGISRQAVNSSLSRTMQMLRKKLAA